MRQPHHLRPAEPACICAQSAPDASHTRSCDVAFHARFFGARRITRSEVLIALTNLQVLDALGGDPVLN